MNSPGYSADGYQVPPLGPTGWTINAPQSGINGPDTGFYSADGSPFAPTSTAGVSDFNFIQNSGTYSSQTVATTAGQEYTLTYDAAARALAGETGDVLEVIIANAINSTPFTTQTPTTITNAEFNAFTLTFTAPSASTGIVFLNNSPSSDSSGTVDVSNVSLTAVPEPATRGLLAVGGLGLLLIGRQTSDLVIRMDF